MNKWEIIVEKSSENESYTFELILSCSYFSISKLITFFLIQPPSDKLIGLETPFFVRL